ncbi:MAG: beta-galactosidase [Clostridia bacterium]|nr:beta-galactosidase [Clostridia bacterium]
MREISFLKCPAHGATILSVSEKHIELLLGPDESGIELDGAAGTTLRYLTGMVEVCEAHALPLTLRFFTNRSETERIHYRFTLLPRMRTRICLDLTSIDFRSGMLPDRTPGLLKAVIHGERTEMEDVCEIRFGAKAVYHPSRVILEDFVLTDEKPDDYPLPDQSVVDRFGQWTQKEWHGKIHTDEELKQAMHALEGDASYPFMNWNRWGGNNASRLARGTGFFTRMKTDDGRWHLLDPDGCDFFSLGMCGINPGEISHITHMEKTLAWLPAKNDPLYGDLLKEQTISWISPEPLKSFNYGQANLRRVYGHAWEMKWKEITYRLLMNSGVNTQGNHSSLDIGNGHTRIPYVMQLKDFPSTHLKIISDFPDVLSEEYHASSIRFASQLKAVKDDPWLVGYFLRNEPGFNFIENICIANEVLHGKESSCCKQGLIAWLKKKYNQIESLNTVWGSRFSSFASLEEPMKNCLQAYPGSAGDLQEYSVFLVREYNRIPSQACKAVDPYHMNLGMRWSHMKNPDMLAGWEYLDVFSFNCYAFDPLPDMQFIAKCGVDCPVIIGEFHCGALDRGLPCTGLKGVETQNDRGIMWRQFAEKCAAHPLGVGVHWFEFNDEFILGRLDGENYQIGLVDVCQQPYQEMVQAMQATAHLIYDVKNGHAEPEQRMPHMIPMIG